MFNTETLKDADDRMAEVVIDEVENIGSKSNHLDAGDNVNSDK